jgi:hypothetical protein
LPFYDSFNCLPSPIPLTVKTTPSLRNKGPSGQPWIINGISQELFHPASTEALVYCKELDKCDLLWSRESMGVGRLRFRKLDTIRYTSRCGCDCFVMYLIESWLTHSFGTKLWISLFYNTAPLIMRLWPYKQLLYFPYLSFIHSHIYLFIHSTVSFT